MAKLLRAKGIGIGFIQDADSAVSWDPLTDETVVGYYTPDIATRHTAPALTEAQAAFDTATGWTVGAGWSIAGGVATHTSGAALLWKAAAFVPNCRYRVPLTIVSMTAGTIQVMVGTAGIGAVRNAAGSYSEVIRCGANNTYYWGISSFVGVIDNVMPEQLSVASWQNQVVGVNPLSAFGQATVAYMPWVESGTMQFDGAGSWAALSSALAVQKFMHQEHTIGVAFRINSGGPATQCLLSTAQTGSSSNAGIYISVSSTGVLTFRVCAVNGVTYAVNAATSAGAVSLGVDHVLTTRLSSSGYSVRLDGVEILAGSIAIPLSTNNPSQVLYLGNTHAAGSQWIKGTISKIVIANDAYDLTKTHSLESNLEGG